MLGEFASCEFPTISSYESSLIRRFCAITMCLSSKPPLPRRLPLRSRRRPMPFIRTGSRFRNFSRSCAARSARVFPPPGAALNFVRSGVDWLWNKIAPLLDALKKLKAWWSGEEAPAAQPAANAPAAPGYAAAVPALSVSPAAAVPALSGADLESMSRAAITHSSGARTDARTFNTNANFTIVQQPGEDAEALARRVSERLAESYSGALAAAL